RKHHAKASCVWVKYAKKKSGIASIDWDQAVDVALCYGWIDGQSKSLDETYSLQRFTPRGKQSKWSKLNRERVARLTRAGRMQPAGIAEVERAKADGRWAAAYDSAASAKVPDDLAAALAKSAKAKKFFDSLSSTNRYSILYRLQAAKKPATRARRLEKFVEMLKKGEKLYP
ncbi:MAG TPA: YdeI/OmpD-associated family protein, partial [Kofleriaceae bacterium]